MTTINISLPDKLKGEAEKLIQKGFFVSFSDLVRHSLRETINKSKYDVWADEAIEDAKNGRGKWLKTDEAIEKFVDTL